MSSVYPPYGGMQSLPCQRCHAPLLPNEATCRNCGYYNAPAQGNNPAGQAPSFANGAWKGAAPQPSAGQGQNQYGNSSWGQFSVPSNSAPADPSLQTPNAFNNPPSMAPLQPGGRNFFGAPVTSASPMEGNGYAANQSASPFAPQRPSGALSAGPAAPQPFVQPAMGPVSQASYGAPSTDPISQAPYGAPTMGPVSQAPYGMPPSGFQQYGAPNVSGQSYPGVGPGPQTAGPQSSPELPGFAPPAIKETPPARRSKSWMIALIVLLVLVLVGGGGFFGYTLLNKPKTAAVTQTVVTTGAAKGTPLFADTFKNNASGWSLPADPGKFSISLANGSLVIEDDSNELLWEPLPGNKTYGDFTLSVDAMLAQGDQTNGYGFYIRGASVQNSEMATYYRFELYGDGSYAIFKGTVDANGNPTYAKLVNYTLSSAIQKQGIMNYISITAKGSSLSLTVNGQVVKTLTDAGYTNGSIAPFVSNMQNAKPGAQAKFSNLTIYAA